MSNLTALRQTSENDNGRGSPLVRLEGLSKSYGSNLALSPLNLEIEAGDFFALLGPSGCGKTTLLRLIGGFLKPSGGKILIAGQDVTLLPPERRRTNIVFPSYGLFPHMTAQPTLDYWLHVVQRPDDEITRKVSNLVSLVHLEGLENRLPSMLSGGQQQRVALARALILEPAVLLLDEPLAALDLKLRKSMQEELRALHSSIGGTFVFVTHDQSEAMALANRIAVMRDGRIEQEGTPKDIYLHPTSEFVARFVGEANIIPGYRRSNIAKLNCGIELPSKGREGPVSLMIRPDDICVSRLGTEESEVTIAGRLIDQVFMGTYVRLTIETAGDTKLNAHIERSDGTAPMSLGTNLTIGWSGRSQRILEGH